MFFLTNITFIFLCTLNSFLCLKFKMFFIGKDIFVLVFIFLSQLFVICVFKVTSFHYDVECEYEYKRGGCAKRPLHHDHFLIYCASSLLCQ
jgi:hypothetical protein